MLILFINKFLRLDLYWAIAVLGLNKKSLIIVMRLLYESGLQETSPEDLPVDFRYFLSYIKDTQNLFSLFLFVPN